MTFFGCVREAWQRGKKKKGVPALGRHDAPHQGRTRANRDAIGDEDENREMGNSTSECRLVQKLVLDGYRVGQLVA